tara:strand:- start:58 stop:342 length:285 start_codon:yes stop_codon:yes gene_type:complete
MQQVNFDLEDIAKVQHAKSFTEAKSNFIKVIERSTVGKSKRPISPNKISYYKKRITELDSKLDLVSLFWNMYMVGEGLGVPNSSYQKNFNSWSR